MTHYDVIISGAGPAGAASAAYLARAGLSVGLFEQASFPRHQIGESLLPFSWRVFEEIGVADKMRAQGFVAKYGASFHSERSKKEMTFRFSNSVSPKYESIYHVDRGVFDALMLDHARSLGVDVHQPVAVRDVEKTADGVLVNDEHTARLLVRAGGITNASVHPDQYVPNAPDDNATGVYTYFKYTPKADHKAAGDILIDLFYVDGVEGGDRIPSWAWAIPINGEVMSVGFVLRTHHFARFRQEGKSIDAIGREILDSLPFIRAAVFGEPLEPYRMRLNFQRVCRQVVHERELFIGDCAGFIDPVFSSGVHIALNSARLSTPAIVEALANGGYDPAPLLAYQETYRRLFWSYYRFVKLFYEKNLVENFFLVADPDADERARELAREFTSILSGDVESPNSIVRSLDTARLNINPEVRAVFQHVGGKDEWTQPVTSAP